MSDASQALYMVLRPGVDRKRRVGPALDRWLTEERVGEVLGHVADVLAAKRPIGVSHLHDVAPMEMYTVWQDRGGGWHAQGDFSGMKLRSRWSDVLAAAGYYPTAVTRAGQAPSGTAERPTDPHATRVAHHLHAWQLADGSLWWPSREAARADMAALTESAAREAASIREMSTGLGFEKPFKRELAKTRKMIAEARAWPPTPARPLQVGDRVVEKLGPGWGRTHIFGRVVEERPEEVHVRFEVPPVGLENYEDPGVWRQRSDTRLKRLE